MEIIRRVMELSVLSRLLGALVLAPIVNVPGFLNLSRYLPDGWNLNRSFPRSARGSLVAQIAKLLLDEIVEGSTHGVDIHTEALHRENFPQIRANLDDREADCMARAFNVPIVLDAGLRGRATRRSR